MTAAGGQIARARTTIEKTHTSRAANALEPEDTVDGVAVWHVREGRKTVVTSLPLPHELDSIDDVTACADIAETVASSHSNMLRVMGSGVSLVFAAVVVIGADAFVGAISMGFARDVPAPYLRLIAMGMVVFLGIFVLSRIEKDINAPEVWERRALAYQRRLVELERVAKDARGCPCPGHERPRRRRWWRRAV